MCFLIYLIIYYLTSKHQPGDEWAAMVMSCDESATAANSTATEISSIHGYGWSASEEGISFYLVIFLTLLALDLVLCKLLRDSRRLASALPEAALTILIGSVAAFIVRVITPTKDANALLTFSPTTFFTALLPPIIFNSGYQLKRELFFDQIGPIVSLACFGTAISAVVVSVSLKIMVAIGLTEFAPSFTELLTFGALISATDPVSTLAVFHAKKVEPRLFYLVFGESVLNDAVGLLLFNALSKFVGNEDNFEKVTVALAKFVIDLLITSSGSLCLGLLSGLIAGWILKVTDMRNVGVIELSLYVLTMYLPFFIAETLHLSGIVTILFSGMSANRYAAPNLSRGTRIQAKAIFRVFAHLAESSIFLELGLSIFGLASRGNFHGKFIACAMLACLMGRAANVYPITTAWNRLVERNRSHDAGTGRSKGSKSDRPIDRSTAHMVWFSGLRGAVAYACAKTFPDANGHRTAFCISTMVIVLVTVCLFGGTTEILLDALRIDLGIDEDEYQRGEGRQSFGIIQTFEERFVFPWVLRDWGARGVSHNEGEKDMRLKTSRSFEEMVGREAQVRMQGHDITARDGHELT